MRTETTGGGEMTENRTRRDMATQSNVPETEREVKDQLPWLIRNLRQKHQEQAEGSPTQDSREQTQ
jgi:hypothetical protein